MKLVKAYKYESFYAVVEFLIRDEVKGKRKVAEAGRSWLECELIINRGGIKIIFRWISWDCVKDEAYGLLKRLGIKWDREEEEDYGLGFKVVGLHKKSKRVATFSCEEHGAIGGRTC